jgi:hypothetical protein
MVSPGDCSVNDPIGTDRHAATGARQEPITLGQPPCRCRQSTVASIALDDNAPLAVVCARLGHANPNVTLRVYTHELRASQGKVANTFAESVRSASK